MSHSKAIEIEHLICDIVQESREQGHIANADTIERMPISCLLACLYYMKARGINRVDDIIEEVIETGFSLCNLTLDEIERAPKSNIGVEGEVFIDKIISMMRDRFIN